MTIREPAGEDTVQRRVCTGLTVAVDQQDRRGRLRRAPGRSIHRNIEAAIRPDPNSFVRSRFRVAQTCPTSLGARLAYPMKLSFGVLTPEVHVNWFHNFGADRLTTTYTTADVSTPGAFTFIGPHGDRDTFNIGVSANLAQSGPWTFGAGYDFAGRSSSSQHLFYLRAKYSF